jgi:hypothetical protein
MKKQDFVRNIHDSIPLEWIGICSQRTISVPTEKGEPMREKLIELLTHDDCPIFMVFGDNMEGLADYLLANGVTVPVKAEGYSFKDREEIDFDYNAEDI